MERSMIAIDLGDVAIHWNPKMFFDGLGNHFAVPPEDVRVFWQGAHYAQKSSRRARADEGLSQRDIHRLFTERFGHTQFEEFISVFTACDMRITDGFPDFLAACSKADADLAILSNTSTIHRDYILGQFSSAFEPHIPKERIYFSCDLGVMKHPDPKHFQSIAQKIGRDVRRIILIDDRHDNVAGIIAAEGDGIVHLGNFEETEKELRKRDMF